ncbi:MAG TPA: carboxypeptidase regulatory-like domain-containing protein, partial [Polyangia bacterium]|nr:carboxypeptidase regulatory-like domain-containing protein [Polyangia bacterium]
YAQETTGGIRGQVTDENGDGVAGATVTVTNEGTGSTTTTVTGGDGGYDVRGLNPGGPYLVSVTEGAHPGKRIRIPAVGVGAPVALNVALEAAGGSVSELVVTAAPNTIKEVTTGPVTQFTSADVATLPSYNRDLRDLVRLNPFVTLDPTNFNALLVAGNNNRVNTIYIDGTKQADDFGLNANGYPSQKSPISTDWVQAFNFEIAPYDVQYGEFQGGVLNVVTKSGSNTFHGGAYWQYDTNDWAAKHYYSVDGTRSGNTRTFYDRYYGGYLSGPIIPNKLFFMGGYEKYETVNAGGTFGPNDDNTFANHVTGLTVQNVTDVTNILKTVYNFDPLGYVSGDLPQTDEKYFARFDWNITDHHRLMVSYQEDDGVTVSNGGSNSTTQLALLSQYYHFNQTLKVWNGQLFSDWTDRFSTEIAYNNKKVASIRAPLQGSSFAQFQIRLASGASVFLGPDISSQANVLQNTDELFRFRAHYKLGSHTFTLGYERENLSVFNLFVQNANGAYTFSNACGPGAGQTNGALINLQAKVACQLVYANAGSNVKNDGAANWKDSINVIYFQDEWAVTPELTLRGGLRAEWYTDATVPTANPRFLANYGIPNTGTYAGHYVVMPRLGFNWRPTDTFTLSGGFGLFSGGTPNVWLSNSYTNTGILLGSVSGGAFTCTSATMTGCSPSLSNVNGLNVGTEAKTANTASAAAGLGVANAVSPDFKPPSVWKFSLTAVKLLDLPWGLGSNWRVHGDFLYQKTEEGITWVDLYALNNRLGTAPDGRPTYNNARFSAAAPPHSGLDLLLVNDEVGQGTTWALGFGKTWRDGWLQGLDFDLTYTHQHVTEANPGTSSVALSNYSQWAISDRNSPEVGISNYQIAYTTKVSLNYSRAFFGDYKTSFRLYAQRRAGLPFSYTFQNANTSSSNNAGEQMFGEVQAAAVRNTQLLYVPQVDATGHITATSDPRVTYNPATFNAATIAAFDQFVHTSGLIKYAGRIAPRNVFKSRDFTTVDLRLEQEIPAFVPHGARFIAFMDIVNLGNLLNKHWGVLEQYSFPGAYPAITARNCQAGAPTPTTCTAGAGNFYQYDSFKTVLPTLNSNSGWFIDLGVKYQF